MENAKLIKKKLFREYYYNIKILPDSALKRIYREIRKFSENVIDFKKGDTKLVRNEIHKICIQGLNKSDTGYILKRKIIARNIADHISGMTDQYTLEEYKKF